MRAWAQKEVSREDGHQVGLSCPGVTQCIPPFAGVLLPHWEGPSPGTGSRPHTHHLFHLVPFGMVKPCSVSWLPLLSAKQIYQKKPHLARLERLQQKALGWVKSSQHRHQRHCKPNSINTDRSDI